MSDAQKKSRLITIRCYRHGVDEKRRVQIPAKWRPEKEGTELTLDGLAATSGGGCLRVLPPSEMAKERRTLTRCRTATRTRSFEKIYWQRIRAGDFGQGRADLSAGRNGSRGGIKE
jgi:DNA-binding transcriptional regulator/RsmH inhibitor MraZ